MAAPISCGCIDCTAADQFEQFQILGDRNLILRQAQFGEGARRRRKRHLILANDIDQMRIRSLKNARFHQYAVEPCPIYSPGIAASLLPQQPFNRLEVDPVAGKAQGLRRRTGR